MQDRMSHDLLPVLGASSGTSGFIACDERAYRMYALGRTRSRKRSETGTLVALTPLTRHPFP
jgi:hypothetical protein